MERLDADRPQSPTLGLQIADILAAEGNTADAEKWLRAALPREPAISWTPYADLAIFAIKRGDTSTAARRLEDGLAFFPQSRDLRLLYARLNMSIGDDHKAESILNAMLEDRPADIEAALLLLALQGSRLSPEMYRARLWKLFDIMPSDHVAFDALASSLVAARDWEGMQIALRQFQESGGQADSRLLLLQGFAAAMTKDDVSATAAFRQSSMLEKNGVARFDLAIVLLRRGNVRSALVELSAAAEEAEQKASLPLLSRIETLRGAALFIDGNMPGAGSALMHALKLDPHNLRAGLLLRKLEAGDQ
jgi:predicted Zn-dependent protease